MPRQGLNLQSSCLSFSRQTELQAYSPTCPAKNKTTPWATGLSSFMEAASGTLHPGHLSVLPTGVQPIGCDPSHPRTGPCPRGSPAPKPRPMAVCSRWRHTYQAEAVSAEYSESGGSCSCLQDLLQHRTCLGSPALGPAKAWLAQSMALTLPLPASCLVLGLGWV